MLVDARTISDRACLEADVCVVGAGPAGLAVAFELDRPGANVIVLAGLDEAAEGDVSGEAYPALEESHAGGVGGSAALWVAELAKGRLGARYAPLAPIDFEQREGVPLSGWPFPREVLDPFYARAHELCDAGPFEYEAAAAAGSPAEVPFVGDGVAAGVFRFGLADAFTRTQSERLARSDAVRVLTNASATSIHRSEDGAEARELEASSAPGRTFRVRARAYVLAAGGIENPRLLLLSGIGNDLVGRCFMDHPTVHCRLDLERRNGSNLGFYDVRSLGGYPVLGHVGLPEETLRERGLLNGGFFVVPSREREVRAASAAKALAQAARERRLPARPLRKAAEAAAGLDAVAFALHRRIAETFPTLDPTLRVWRRSALLDTLGVGAISGWSSVRGRGRTFDLHHVIEQAPDPERRVTLGARRDAFGLPVAHLHWFVGRRELESAEQAQGLLADALVRRGLGRLRTSRQLAPEGDLAAAVHPSAHHHLGTTRMHADERHGVADANGRVHGSTNLFVAGGSAFPTGGFVNPTLTIVALALRLGAFLRQDVLQ